MNFKSKTDKSNASIYDNAKDLITRKRVTRTIVFEGPAVWVDDTLARSWVKPGEPIWLGIGAAVTEFERVEEGL